MNKIFDTKHLGQSFVVQPAMAQMPGCPFRPYEIVWVSETRHTEKEERIVVLRSRLNHDAVCEMSRTMLEDHSFFVPEDK